MTRNLVAENNNSESGNASHGGADISNSGKMLLHARRYAAMPLFLIPILFYPPFLFTPQIASSLRIGSFILLIGYLLLATKRFHKQDLFVFFIICFLFISTAIKNSGNVDALLTVGNMMLTLVFAYVLSRAVEMNEHVKKNIIKIYIKFFTWVPICTFLSLVFFLTIGEFNLFNIPYSQGYNYHYTPFGVLIDKSFFGFHAYRSFFFFIEPVYLALFYAANVFLVTPYVNEKNRFFLVVNIVGGVLTFSYLFFVLSALFFLIKTTNRSSNILRLFLSVCLIIAVPVFDFFADSSLSRRAELMDIFFEAMNDANVYQFMFGRGFDTQTELAPHFSAGLLSAIYEVGVINLAVITIFLSILSHRNVQVFILYFVAMLVVEATKLPLFWVLVVVVSALNPSANIVKKIWLFSNPANHGS